MRKYKHLSLEERETLYFLQNQNESNRQIGQLLGISPATIAREISRSRCAKLGYLPDRAHNLYNKRRNIKPSKLQKNPELRKYVIEKLSEGKWSPEAIAGGLKHHEQIGTISQASIYKFIYSKEGNKMKLYQHLMYRRPIRQSHCIRIKRPLVSREHGIALRSEEVANRSSFGHFEGDLTFLKGSNSSNLITLIERKTRKTFIAHNENKTANSTISKLLGQIKNMVQGTMKSLTLDNGGEFRRFASLGLMVVKVWFCTPHSPWQKGSIERMHVSLHKFIPKKSDIRMLSKDKVTEAQDLLNNLPRKILNFLIPNEAWNINLKQSVPLQS